MNQQPSTPALGVIFHPTFPPETLPDFARRAEQAGFDELWLWDDCFTPGALTAAAIALSATQRIKVGIGLMPATAINPLFAAMEFTTLARTFPGRFLPGIGHGVDAWMHQIGAAPKSSLKSIEETVTAIRQIMQGQKVTLHGSQVNLDNVQLKITADEVPPLLVGGMREKTLRLAGRVGDGSILVDMSSPAYVRWVWEQVRAGMAETGRTQHQLVVYTHVKVSPDGESARAAVRQRLAVRLPWFDQHLNSLGITAEVAEFVKAYGAEGVKERLPDAWLDAFAAAGTPQQVVESLDRMAQAGASSIVFQPLDGDPDCLDEYIRHLMPLLRPEYFTG